MTLERASERASRHAIVREEISDAHSLGRDEGGKMICLWPNSNDRGEMVCFVLPPRKILAIIWSRLVI